MDMEVNESGGSAPPIGGHDTSIPPEVLADVRYFCEGCSDMVLREVAAWYIENTAKFNELVARTNRHPPGTIIITDAEFAERAREARKNDVECFPVQYSYYNNIKEKSSGIMWVGVHGADSICVVTKKGDLDPERLRGNYFKFITVQAVLALFRKSIICEIEDLVDPSTEVRQSIQESIKKPFGVVSANPGINNIYNGSGNEASSALYYEEKAIGFLNEKMNRHIDFTVDETIKTAVCAFQCLFPKKLKATEIEVSVMDPRYRVADHEDEFADRTVWEVTTDVYEKYLDAVDESGEPLIIPKKRRLTALESQGGPPAGSSNILLGYALE